MAFVRLIFSWSEREIIKLLLSPLIIEAYSLSARMEYPFEARRSANKNPDVLAPVPAGPEKAIVRCISLVERVKNIENKSAFYLFFNSLILW